MEMQDEVLSKVGAQNLYTSGSQFSVLEEIEFYWQDPGKNMNAVFRSCLKIFFSLSNFNDVEKGSVAENPILIDEVQHKDNSPSPPRTASSEKTTPPPVLMKNHPFGTTFDNVPKLYTLICLNELNVLSFLLWII